MKRKFDCISGSDSDESELVRNALQEFVKGIHLALPLRRLRDFYEETKIREIAQVERRKIFENFMVSALNFSGEKVGDLVKELEMKIQKQIDEFILTNDGHRKRSEDYVETAVSFLCDEFKTSMEVHCSLDPRMGLETFKKHLEDEKAEAMKCFQSTWKPGSEEFHVEQLAKFEERINRLQSEFEKNTKVFLEGPAERKFFETLEHTLLERIERLKSYIATSTQGSMEKTVLSQAIDELKEHLRDGDRFSKESYRQIYEKLVQCMASAEDMLERGSEVVQSEAGTIVLAVEDAILLVLQLDGDLRRALMTQPSKRKDKEPADVKKKRLRLDIKLLMHAKMLQYKNKMKKTYNPNGCDPNQLELTHHQLLESTTEFVQTKIREFDRAEATAVYCTNLKERIGRIWESIKKKNAALLEKRNEQQLMEQMRSTQEEVLTSPPSVISMSSLSGSEPGANNEQQWFLIDGNFTDKSPSTFENMEGDWSTKTEPAKVMMMYPAKNITNRDPMMSMTASVSTDNGLTSPSESELERTLPCWSPAMSPLKISNQDIEMALDNTVTMPQV